MHSCAHLRAFRFMSGDTSKGLLEQQQRVWLSESSQLTTMQHD